MQDFSISPNACRESTFVLFLYLLLFCGDGLSYKEILNMINKYA